MSTGKYDLAGVTSEIRCRNHIEVNLKERNEMHTLYGDMVPKYSSSDPRRKNSCSISFYKDGSARSIDLEQQAVIDTVVGPLPAEMVTFYQSGKLKRLFPVNGRITGYWTEEDEGRVCPEVSMELPFCSFKEKLISVGFHESGNLKSVSLWPGCSVDVYTPIGIIPVRIGFTLYDDGGLRSLEPKKETLVSTPIGPIHAYDVRALGIHGENGSLRFDEEGNLSSLRTTSECVHVSSEEGDEVLCPRVIRSMMDPMSYEVVPLEIGFSKDGVVISDDRPHVYDLNGNEFRIERLNRGLILTNQMHICDSCNS